VFRTTPIKKINQQKVGIYLLEHILLVITKRSRFSFLSNFLSTTTIADVFFSWTSIHSRLRCSLRSDWVTLIGQLTFWRSLRRHHTIRLGWSVGFRSPSAGWSGKVIEQRVFGHFDVLPSSYKYKIYDGANCEAIHFQWISLIYQMQFMENWSEKSIHNTFKTRLRNRRKATNLGEENLARKTHFTTSVHQLHRQVYYSAIQQHMTCAMCHTNYKVKICTLSCRTVKFF